MAQNFSHIPSPCFVLEENLLRKNLELMKKVQEDSGVAIILAFKGFSMWSAFPLVRQYLKGATASSLHEAQLCVDEMKTPSHTYAVAYKPDEIANIADLSSHLTFNSLSQYHKFIDEIPSHVSVGLRVNPGWSDVETDLYNPSSLVSRLGMTAETVPANLPDRIEGLHFHVLCESSAEALVEVLNHFEAKYGHLLPKIKWVNMGGGHLMTRADYNVPLLIQTLKNFKAKYKVDVILEPGSAVAWQTGFLKSTILDIIENNGVKTAIADISFTCHMPDCLEMPYRPRIRNASMNPADKPHQYRIGGVSCLAGDFMTEYGFDTQLEPGDELIFEDMIHYTMVKTSTFNGVQHPAIGIIRENGDFDLIRKFEYLDFKKRLS